MATISTEVPHSLPKAEATVRLRAALDKRRGELEQQASNLETTWSGEELAFSFSTYGFKVDGTMRVGPDSVKVVAKVPMAALMFKETIEQTIQKEVGTLLA